VSRGSGGGAKRAGKKKKKNDSGHRRTQLGSRIFAPFASVGRGGSEKKVRRGLFYSRLVHAVVHIREKGKERKKRKGEKERGASREFNSSRAKEGRKGGNPVRKRKKKEKKVNTAGGGRIYRIGTKNADESVGRGRRDCVSCLLQYLIGTERELRKMTKKKERTG